MFKLVYLLCYSYRSVTSIVALELQTALARALNKRLHMSNQTNLANRILDQALELAEASSWETLRLHEVADALNISMDDIRRCYPQKDDLVEAWFDRADQAVLENPPIENFRKLPPPERIHQVIMTWLDALAKHRRLTRQMLMYKLEPGHIHLQALGIMRISRTVQWFREAAYLETKNMQRIIEEVSLTTIYLASFTRWLCDDSPHSQNTQACLDSLLRQWDNCGNTARKLFCRPAVRPEPHAERSPPETRQEPHQTNH